MKIIMIWGQRRESYPGEYAPELLEAIDENGDDDNPTFIDDAYRKYCSDNDFTAIKIIAADVGDKKIAEIFSRDSVDLKNVRVV